MTTEFHMEVKDTTLIWLAKKVSAPPTLTGLSYWALSFDAFDEYGDFSPILVNVYCHGEMPGEDRRDQINAAIQSYVGELLTGEPGEGHIEDLHP